MKFSKRDREEAIQALENGAQFGNHYSCNDLSPGALSLADHACLATPLPYTRACLEGAALLRDGWEPGDPIYWLKTGEVVQ